MWFDDKHIKNLHGLFSWPNLKSLRDGYADYNPSVWKNYFIYIYLKTPLFQFMALVIFSGLNFYTYQIWNSEFLPIFLGFILLSFIFTLISLTKTSFTIPDMVVFPLFTLIVISFIYQGSTFPLIYLMYIFYTIKVLQNNGLKFRKPKSDLLKIVGNQGATVEYHYSRNCWIFAVFNTYSKYLFVMCYAYSYYYSAPLLLFFSFGNIWFILMNEMLIKLCGNMFSRTFGMVTGKKVLSSATAAIGPAVATGGLVAGVHYSNKLHATTPGADYQSTGFSLLLGNAQEYQKKAGLKITYDTNYGRDISHAYKNSIGQSTFDAHILDENGTPTYVSKKPANGPLTQQQFTKVGIERVPIKGTTVYELKYTNGPK